MNNIIKKILIPTLALCLMVACNHPSSPQRGYRIGDPVNYDKTYISLNSVVQKTSLSIENKLYNSSDGAIYLIFNLNVKFKEPFSLDTVTYGETGLYDYTLNKELSQKLSNISKSEWTSFTSPEQKHLQLVFEGPDKLNEMTYETFDMVEPFLIGKDEITTE